jgi:hypothetical protein
MASPTPSHLVDLDTVLNLVQLPIALVGFAVLIVAGAWNDWRARG